MTLVLTAVEDSRPPCQYHGLSDTCYSIALFPCLTPLILQDSAEVKLLWSPTLSVINAPPLCSGAPPSLWLLPPLQAE